MTDQPPPQEEPTESLPPTVVPLPPEFTPPVREHSRYRLIQLHARGNLGEVFLAHDTELNREVALKQMQEHIAHSGDLRRRFLLEAEITGRLEHPGIVPVYGMGVDEQGRPYYAMRFIRGESLHQAVQRLHANFTSMGLRQLLGRFIAVCAAVAYAHSRGVIHRDLKPANIMLGEFGETLVVDWGLAKHVQQSEPGTAEAIELVPNEGLQGAPTRGAIGTPAFMSPEQATLGGQVGARSDVYALGATLYTVLTGKPPIESPFLEEILARVRAGEFPAPRLKNPKVPPALEAICLKAMAFRPEDRYATASDLATDLEAYLADEPVSARAEPFGERMRRWVKRHRTLSLATLAAGFVALVALGLSTALLNAANEAEREARQEATTAAELARRQRDEADQQRQKAELARRQADEAREAAFKSELQERQHRYVSNIQFAHQAWQVGQVSRARQLLRDLIPRHDQDDLRGFEWRYLWRLCHESLTRTHRPHLAAVSSLAFTPDRRLILSASHDGCILLWDAETGRPVRSFLADPEDTSGRLGVTWTRRQDKMVVSAILPGSSALLDGRLRVGDELVSITEEGGLPITHFAESLADQGPVGSAVILEVRRRGKTFRLTLLRRRLLQQATGLSRPVPMAVLTPDGTKLVTAFHRTVRLWNLTTGELEASFTGHQGQIRSLALAPNGKLLATGDDQTTIRLWDIQRRHPAGAITYRPSTLLRREGFVPVRSLAFSPDGQHLLAGTTIWLLRLDPARRRIDNVVVTPEHFIETLAFHPEGQQFAIGFQSNSNNIELWDLQKGKLEQGLHGHTATVHALSYTPDGERLISVSRDQTVRVWDRREGRTLQLLRGHARAVTALACAGDNLHLATGDAEGVVLLHSLEQDPQADVLSGRLRLVTQDLAFDPQGTALFAAAGDPWSEHFDLTAWDPRTARFRGQIVGMPPGINSAVFTPDSKTLLVGTSDVFGDALPGVIRQYDVASGQRLRDLPRQNRAAAGHLLLAADGETLISTGNVTLDSREGELFFWKYPSLELLSRHRPHQGNVIPALSHDGRSLVTVGFDTLSRSNTGEAWLWDLAKRRPRHKLSGNLASTSSASISPDGRRLVTASLNLWLDQQPASVQVWDVTTGQPILSLQGHHSHVEPVIYAPDGKTIWLGAMQQGIHVHEATTGKLLRTLPLKGGLLNAMSFSTDGQSVTIGVGPVTVDEKILPSYVQVLETETFQQRYRFEHPPGCFVSSRFSPDQRWLASWNSLGDLYLHDLTSKTVKRLGPTEAEIQARGHSGVVSCLAVSPDGKTLASGTWNGTVELWDLLPGQTAIPARLRQTISVKSVVSCLAFAPDGRTLAWGTGSLRAREPGGLTLYDLASQKELATISTAPAGITALTFAPDGETLICATDHFARNAGPSEIWRVQSRTGAVREVIQRGSFLTHSLAFSPDGHTLAFERAPHVVLLDLRNGAMQQLPGQSGIVHRIRFAPDGKTVATTHAELSTKLWHVATGRELLLVMHDEEMEAMEFSRDGRTLALGGSANGRSVVRLWRADPVALISRTWYHGAGTGLAQRRVTHDEQGTVLEEAFFDASGAAVLGPDGYHRFTRHPRPRYEDISGNELTKP